jgi:hypothetical protein
MSQGKTLKAMITKENVQNLIDTLLITDESSAIPMNKLDIMYAVIKTGMTKPGGRQVQLGEIFVPDGDDGVLINFKDEQGAPMLDGIVISMFQEKTTTDSDDPNVAPVPSCGTVFIPPVMGKAGYRNGDCARCVYGKYVEGTVSSCLPVTKFIMLREVKGELKLVQIKAKGINQKPSKDAWVAFSGKVKGRTLSTTAIFGTRTAKHKAKDGKEYDIDFWTISPGEQAGLSVEQQELLRNLKTLVQEYHVSKYHMMKEIVAADNSIGMHHQQYVAHSGAPSAPAITHTAAPVNQVADLAIEAEVISAPVQAPVADAAEPKKVLRKAASDISV